MKKFLSLVLALVMTMSLVTISAGAKDYVDEADISYNEAVDVLSAIGVLQGDDNGFRPNDTLKRSEAAKIIAALNLTPATAASLKADVAPFADVAVNHWAAAYIAYAKSEGIINGVGDNKFAPDAELTGFQFLKMLLVTLGYDAKLEGMTGGNWSIKVAELANQAGLTKGNDDFVGINPVTREEAALYALNALKANCIKYATKGTTITVGGTEIVTGASAPSYVPQAADKLLKDDAYMQLAEKVFPKLKLAAGDNTEFDAPANTWTFKNAEVGTYAAAADATLNNKVTFGNLYTAAGATAIKNLANLYVYVNGKAETVDASKITKGNTAELVNTGAAKLTGNSALTQVFVEENAADDTKYDVTVVIVKTYAAKISSITAATASADRKVNLTVKGATVGTLTSASYETEQFAKNDYVLYTAAEQGDGTFKIQTLVPAIVENGVTVTSVKGTTNFVADGTTYQYSCIGGVSAPAVDDELMVVKDENGYVVYTEAYNGVVDMSNYLVLVDTQATTSLGVTTVKANAVTMDGKWLGAIVLGKLDGVKITATTDVGSSTSPYTMYSFTKTEEGKYNLKSVASPFSTGTAGASVAYNTGDASFNGTPATTATQFVVYNSVKDTVKVYSGIKNMVNVASANMTGSNVLIKNGKAVGVFVEATAVTSNDSSAKDLVYLLDTTPVTTKDGDDTVYTYAAIVDGKVTTMATKTLANDLTLSAKGLYFISTYDGVYFKDIAVAAEPTYAPNDTEIVKATAAAAQGGASYSDDVLVINKADGSKTTVVLGEGCAIYEITKDATGKVTTKVAEDLTNETSNYQYTAVVYNNNGLKTATAIYVQKV